MTDKELQEIKDWLMATGESRERAEQIATNHAPAVRAAMEQAKAQSTEQPPAVAQEQGQEEEVQTEETLAPPPPPPTSRRAPSSPVRNRRLR